MKKSYHTIYLSPHLDDAALSCGGQIFGLTSAGEDVLILTIMAGQPGDEALSPFAAMLHQRWQLGVDAVALRRQEDVTACHILGADYLHWDVPDCIYRQSEDGQWLYPEWTAVITTLHPADEHLITQLASLLQTLPPAQRIVAPLGVGSHVDHRIVRAAAEKAFSGNLWYYEDYPYVREQNALTKVIPTEEKNAWQVEIIPLTPTQISRRTDAIAAYKSQVDTFFNGRIDLNNQITAYTQKVGGERLWQPQPPNRHAA
ncbi:MAG: PIG-L family deacetylase [Candidatus Promineifilaceae bacterium]